MLLVQGSAKDINQLTMSGEMLVLDSTTNLPRTRKAPLVLLVMNAGGYKFMDFVKVGIPLTVIMWLALTVILTLAYDI